MRLILELDFPILVGEEQPMARRVHNAAVHLVRLQQILGVKMPQAAAAPVEGVFSRQVGHEASEVFNPGVVLLPVEQVDRPLKCLLRCIERVPPLPLIVEEGVEMNPNAQLDFNGGSSWRPRMHTPGRGRYSFQVGRHAPYGGLVGRVLRRSHI